MKPLSEVAPRLLVIQIQIQAMCSNCLVFLLPLSLIEIFAFLVFQTQYAKAKNFSASMGDVYPKPICVTQTKIAKMVQMRWTVNQVRKFGPHLHNGAIDLINFRYCKKAKKFDKISPSILNLLEHTHYMKHPLTKLLFYP